MSFFHSFANLDVSSHQTTEAGSSHPTSVQQIAHPQSQFSSYTNPSQLPGSYFVDLNSISLDEEVVYDSQFPIDSYHAQCDNTPPPVDHGTHPPRNVHRTTSKRTKRASTEDPTVSKQYTSRFHWDSRTITVLIEVKRAHELRRFHAGVGGRSKTLEEQWCEVVTTMAGRGVLVPEWKAAYDKWKRLVSVHKEISDWERNTPSGKNSYWQMTARERKEEGKFGNLNFDRDIFDLMERMYGRDPVVNPPTSVVDSSNNTNTPSPVIAHSDGVEDTFERTATNGGVAKKVRKRTHVYDVGLKEATKDIAQALDAADDAKALRHKEMADIERSKVEIAMRSAMGIEGLSIALSRIAGKM